MPVNRFIQGHNERCGESNPGSSSLTSDTLPSEPPSPKYQDEITKAKEYLFILARSFNWYCMYGNELKHNYYRGYYCGGLVMLEYIVYIVSPM